MAQMSSNTTQDAHQPVFGCQHLFQKLPQEIRFMIWKLNLPSTRLVQVRCGRSSLEVPLGTISGLIKTCWPRLAIPANLHICREARLEALKRYKHCFGMAGAAGQVYFNNELDILYFADRKGYMATSAQFFSVMSLCDQDCLKDVRMMAINDKLFGDVSESCPVAIANLATDVVQQVKERMPRLERLLIISASGSSGYGMCNEKGKLVLPDTRFLDRGSMVYNIVKNVLDHMLPKVPTEWHVMPVDCTQNLALEDRRHEAESIYPPKPCIKRRKKFTNEENEFLVAKRTGQKVLSWSNIHRQFTKRFSWRSEANLRNHFSRILRSRNQLKKALQEIGPNS